MIISSAQPLVIGEHCTRWYEGPQTKGNQIEVRICALRVATREEYLAYGYSQFGEEFEPDEDLRRGWNNYYLVSMD
jgi:hypothetical protein